MASLEQIRAGLGSALKAAITGVQVSDYVLGNPTSPGFEIDLDPEGVNYDEAMGRGLDEWFLLVRGFVAETLDEGSQRVRDGWLASSGKGSVKAAIETWLGESGTADPGTLGGACDSLHVVNARPRSFVVASAPNTTYVGAEWRVRILATG